MISPKVLAIAALALAGHGWSVFGQPRTMTEGAHRMELMLERLDGEYFRVGRSKRLRADGAPRDLHVMRVSRA